MKLLNILAIVSLLATPAYAQYNPSPNDPQAPVDVPRYHGTLADFDKVQLLCASDTGGDYISNALCTVADTEVRAGARQVGMSFVAGSNREEDDTFMIYVHITSAGRVPRGMSVHVEASRYYSEAVDRSARNSTAAAFRRAGKMVFWEDNITGVGQGDSLEEPMRRRLRQLIQQLFKQIEDQKDGH